MCHVIMYSKRMAHVSEMENDVVASNFSVAFPLFPCYSQEGSETDD